MVTTRIAHIYFYYYGFDYYRKLYWSRYYSGPGAGGEHEKVVKCLWSVVT